MRRKFSFEGEESGREILVLLLLLVPGVPSGR